MSAKTKRVKCRSGLIGWQCRLRDNYLPDASQRPHLDNY